MEKDTDGVTGCVRDSLALYIFARCFCSSEMALLKLCLFCATDLTAFKLNGWFVQSKNAVCIIQDSFHDDIRGGYHMYAH